MVPCPFTIGRDQPLSRAHQMMREHGIRHLPVLDGGRLVGVVSSRDLYFIETLRDVDSTSVKVDEAMTESPYVVTTDTPLHDVANAMAEHHYGCAIVTDAKGVAGIFTTVDGMRTLARLLDERKAA
jgi:acetoin utilization protein AcuB